MRHAKSNFTAYSSLPGSAGFSKAANILDLIKRNKEEERKEKVRKIYLQLGFVGLTLVFGIIVFL